MPKLLAKAFLLFIILTAILHLYFSSHQREAPQINFGVTYSPAYAGYLNLDPKKTYLAILDDLKVRNLRLMTFWDRIEKQKDRYDFSETDFLIDQAKKRDAKILLVVGMRQPRWPECHIPSWAHDLDSNQKQQAITEVVKKVVLRYKDNGAIWGFQVENEPTLSTFGEGCPAPDVNFLTREVNLVRQLAPNKKIVLTDAGEISAWTPEMGLSDVFGTSVYRVVYDRYLGYFKYPLPPYFYSLKSRIVKKLAAPTNQKTIISELQTEPWLTLGVKEIPVAEQAQIFPVKSMQENLAFSKQTGFDTIDLWGVEWWYFMAEHGHPEYLNYARTVFAEK